MPCKIRKRFWKLKNKIYRVWQIRRKLCGFFAQSLFSLWSIISGNKRLVLILQPTWYFWPGWVSALAYNRRQYSSTCLSAEHRNTHANLLCVVRLFNTNKKEAARWQTALSWLRVPVLGGSTCPFYAHATSIQPSVTILDPAWAQMRGQGDWRTAVVHPWEMSSDIVHQGLR